MQDGRKSTIEALEALATHAREAGVFGQIQLDPAHEYLECRAQSAAAAAFYRVEHKDGQWFVSLSTPDRWLSESIEAELMHSGDTLQELIEEELVDLGVDPDVVPVEHFRNDQLLYVFRTQLPSQTSEGNVSTWLLAYEAAFRPLGDMSAKTVD